jgi:hypothetical protein
MSLFEVFMTFGWPAVQIIVSGFVMYLFRCWMVAGRDRPAAQAHRMSYSPGIMIFGLAVFAAFGSIGRSWLGEGETFAGGGCLVFASMGLYLVIVYLFSRHELFDGGIHFNGPLTCRRTLRWSDMTSVRYGLRMKSFRLVNQAGETFYIENGIRGLPPFAEAVLAQVPPQALDEATRCILEATAQGKPPEMFD